MKLRQASIDLDAIRHNYEIVKQLAPHAKVTAMIKSDAYGHGLIPVAKTLDQVESFGVSVIEEAIALRDAGISQRIILMTGAQTDEELQLCVERSIDIVVHDPDHLTMLAGLKGDNLITVWLKLDVGMHRLGFAPDQADEIYRQLSVIAAVVNPIFLMTHLSNADQLSDSETARQLKEFKSIASHYQSPCSVAKSAGILAWPESHYDWVRPGIMLYGISPLQDQIGEHHGLRPAMSFTTKVVAVKQLHQGDPVSYGGIWCCPEDMKVAVVGVGYSDGYPRHARSGTPVLINGQRCQLVGRVCMDMFAVDIRGVDDVKIGDNVTLWGPGLPIEDVARHADTIAYEIICHVSDRVKKIL